MRGRSKEVGIEDIEGIEGTGVQACGARAEAAIASEPAAIAGVGGTSVMAEAGDAKPPAGAASAPEAPAEEDVARVAECVLAHPRHRELLYKALAYCAGAGARGEDDVEAYLRSQPEYASALQDAHTLLRTLVRCGGLDRRDLDAQGCELTKARLEQIRAERGLDRPLSQDEVADLVAGHSLALTPAGASVVALLDPQHRIAACCEADPERTNVFLEILQLCETPHTLRDIRELVADDPVCDPTPRTAHLRLEPSFFIDRLSEAGALVWDGAWVTTEQGRRYLASA